MKAFHTENYVGEHKKNYFEGWYFRHGGEDPFSFIVGVTHGSDAHAFVQFIDRVRSRIYRFPVGALLFEEKDMTVVVGENVFSLRGIDAELGEGEERVCCHVRYGEITPFQKSLFAPSVMGPFGYFPMVCNHAVVSMRHSVKGEIERGGKRKEVDAQGYIEKDFGSRFPENYFWLHAANERASVMFAVAWPLNLGLRGFLCLFTCGGRQYNLSLYTGARLEKCEVFPDRAEVKVRRGKTALSLYAQSDGGMPLAAPTAGANMTRTVRENLSARCKIALTLGGREEELGEISECAFECDLSGGEPFGE